MRLILSHPLAIPIVLHLLLLLLLLLLLVVVLASPLSLAQMPHVAAKTTIALHQSIRAGKEREEVEEVVAQLQTGKVKELEVTAFHRFEGSNLFLYLCLDSV